MTARLREFVTLPFDASSPLNQAYLMERRAEDSANLANYSDSNSYYNLAIGMYICSPVAPLQDAHLLYLSNRAFERGTKKSVASEVSRAHRRSNQSRHVCNQRQ